MMRRNPSSAFSVASMVAEPRRPWVKVSLPRRTPRETSSRMRRGSSGRRLRHHQPDGARAHVHHRDRPRRLRGRRRRRSRFRPHERPLARRHQAPTVRRRARAASDGSASSIFTSDVQHAPEQRRPAAARPTSRARVARRVHAHAERLPAQADREALAPPDDGSGPARPPAGGARPGRARRGGPRGAGPRTPVLPARRRAAMIAGHVGEHLDLQGREPPQAAVLDQVVGVLVVAHVRDVVADVVEEGGVLEERPRARRPGRWRRDVPSKSSSARLGHLPRVPGVDTRSARPGPPRCGGARRGRPPRAPPSAGGGACSRAGCLRAAPTRRARSPAPPAAAGSCPAPPPRPR